MRHLLEGEEGKRIDLHHFTVKNKMLRVLNVELLIMKNFLNVVCSSEGPKN